VRRLVGVAIVGILAWQVYLHYQHGMRPAVAEPADAVAVQFKCDGRTYCSQMTSCEEATFFLRNCPGVRMDGNNDGVPCEKQWCRR
jgi:hypothetical protein